MEETFVKTTLLDRITWWYTTTQRVYTQYTSFSFSSLRSVRLPPSKYTERRELSMKSIMDACFLSIHVVVLLAELLRRLLLLCDGINVFVKYCTNTWVYIEHWIVDESYIFACLFAYLLLFFFFLLSLLCKTFLYSLTMRKTISKYTYFLLHFY